jgi:hypothetical protein
LQINRLRCGKTHCACSGPVSCMVPVCVSRTAL